MTLALILIQHRYDINNQRTNLPAKLISNSLPPLEFEPVSRRQESIAWMCVNDRCGYCLVHDLCPNTKISAALTTWPRNWKMRRRRLGWSR
ncbi:hypothetical protein EYC84_009818 [Monilinia fructicola]|uniref:Uncharacterized protein n=1 Tax=Monilinia fructicola TaxID=38448 RepID=A0A5M9J8R6_MONFR|nr:hypothetical protein EYC84_009818 [Monilinia fructicola]